LLRATKPHRALALVFFVTGAAFGTWAARIPSVQDRLELSEGDLGVAFAGLMVGAFAALPPAGALVARLGSRVVLVGSLLVFLPALALVPFAPNVIVLTVLLTVFGASNSGVDVAINTQGADLERRLGRPLLSGLHAQHPLGALVAAAVAAGLATAGVSVAVHFVAGAALLLAAGLAATRFLLDEPREAQPRRTFALPTRALLWPGVVAFCAVFAEDVANTWSAVYLRSEAGSGTGLAALAFAFYAAGVLVGRAFADRVVGARGVTFTLRLGGLAAVAGVALLLAVPNPALAIVGLFLLGLGLGPVFPVLFGAVGARDPALAATSIAAVTTVGYLGSVVGPPGVGAVAGPLGLRAALVSLVVCTLAVALLAARTDDA
jgi:MFS family permease